MLDFRVQGEAMGSPGAPGCFPPAESPGQGLPSGRAYFLSIIYSARESKRLRLETDRLIITHFSPAMAESLHLNSLDEDNRRFVPDEVFETVEDAKKVMTYLMNCYEHGGPLVYPVLLKDGGNIGYVQAVPLEKDGWEIGYHIAKKYTGRGYATEAVSAFLPVIMRQLHIKKIKGICLPANRASIRVLENCGFTKEYEGQGFYQGEQREICRFTYCI